MTRFTQLNKGWNAEPNAPEIEVKIDGASLILSFSANSYQYPLYKDGQVIKIGFHNAWRYGIGDVNDEGWYRGQCRFSRLAPAWGEFYEVSGDLLLGQVDFEWHVLTDTPAPNLKHFLFYFRDENFECDAASWERIQ